MWSVTPAFFNRLRANPDGSERVVCYHSRQLQSYERNYPVHEMELLAMKYVPANFRVYPLGDRPFVVYTDLASLYMAVNSPHISHIMAMWLFFLTEYNFSMDHKPGRLNVVADALSRRPKLESAAQSNSGIGPTVATLVASVTSSTLADDIKGLRRRYGSPATGELSVESIS